MSSRKNLARRDFERILLIKPSSLGDVIHALPVLERLRGRYPDAQIDWLIHPAFASLIEGHPDLSEAILFDRRRFSRLGRDVKIGRDFFAFLAKLRRRRYDLAIDLQGLFRSGFLAWASGAGVRVGFAHAREAAPLFYTHRLRADSRDRHAVDLNLLVTPLLGLPEKPVRFDLHLTPEDRQAARTLLREAGVPSDKPLVAAAPGARWETKRWPAERFVETLDALEEEGVACVLLGSPEEREACERIVARCRRPPVNLAGRTSVRVMAAVVERCDVVVCHDSAPMHVAAALERPLVCIIGPTNPARTGPYRRLDDALRLNLDCSPCYLKRLSQCPHRHRCMNDLGADRVIRAVLARLKPSSDSSATR